MQLREGSKLQNGKYRIIRVLGQGGFGITYLAENTFLDRKIAIKEFFPKDFCSRDNTSHLTLGTQNNAETVEKLKARFLKEAKNIARLDHPGIIKIHDIFEDNNTAYYVMDYIEGENLNEMVKRNGPLSEAKAVEYIRKVGDALDYIHSRNMTHFDVKPANIMVRRSDDQPILIDFGLSKQYDAHGDATSTLMQGVSHGYSPIELYNPGSLSSFSPQTDVYSLGATLFFLLTGSVPPSASDLLDNGLTIPSYISDENSSAIRKAMSVSRTKRPQNITSFVEELSIHGQRYNSYQEPTAESDEDTVFINQKSQQSRSYSDIKKDHPVDSDYKSKSRSNTTLLVSGIVIFILVLIYFFSTRIGIKEKDKSVTDIKTENVYENPQSSGNKNKNKSKQYETNSDKTLTPISNHVSGNEERTSSSNPTFTSFNLANGSISIPSFLTFKGKSDDGEYVFLDTSNQIRLYLKICQNQDINSFKDWVNRELGYGTTLLSKANRFVQSGYTDNNEIYYCKAFMDNSVYPQVMYTAIMLYPITRRNEIDGLLAKMFNPFPNIK